VIFGEGNLSALTAPDSLEKSEIPYSSPSTLYYGKVSTFRDGMANHEVIKHHEAESL